MREQDVRIIDLGEAGEGLPRRFMMHPAGHVMDVQRALAQVGIVHLLEQLGVAAGDLLEDGLDVAPVALQRAQHLVDERAVFDDEQVGVEDAGVLRADGLGDLGLHFEDLRACRSRADSKRAISAGRSFSWTV